MANAGGTKPLTSSVFYVLLALSDQDRHGLGIAADIEERTDGAVQIGPGTLYNAIRKMLDLGLIEGSDHRSVVDDDPRRRYYRISAAGRRAVRSEAERLSVVLSVAHDKALLTRGEVS